MGPVARLLIFLLRLCPSVTTVTPTEATQESEDDLSDLEDDQPIDDWPSQEALENHMTLAYLEHCKSLPDANNHPSPLEGGL